MEGGKLVGTRSTPAEETSFGSGDDKWGGVSISTPPHRLVYHRRVNLRYNGHPLLPLQRGHPPPDLPGKPHSVDGVPVGETGVGLGRRSEAKTRLKN